MHKRTVAITQYQAIEIVRNVLAIANSNPGAAHKLVVRENLASEIWWAWIVPCCTEEFARTGNPMHLLLGAGPYLIDKFTGEAIPTGSGTYLHQLERERGYRAWWKFWGPNRMLCVLNRLESDKERAEREH